MKKSENALFSENQFCSLLLWELLRLTPWYFGLKFFQTFVTVSVNFLLRFEPQIRPTRLAINFLFITARDERKVRLCAKLFDFCRG